MKRARWRYFDVPEPEPRAHLFPDPDASALCGRIGPTVPVRSDDDTPDDDPANCPRCRAVARD